jgi:hypothetical protein
MERGTGGRIATSPDSRLFGRTARREKTFVVGGCPAPKTPEDYKVSDLQRCIMSDATSTLSRFTFRESRIPGEVLSKLVTGEINGTDLTVFVIVDALVRWSKKRCNATNAYIGRSVGIGPTSVSHCITKLARLGILLITRENNTRYLETAWSKAEETLRQLKSMPYKEYLQTDHWNNVRLDTLKRADYRCQLCNADVPLQAHHRTYERRGEELPGDTIALCRPCHTKHHGIIEEGQP